MWAQMRYLTQYWGKTNWGKTAPTPDRDTDTAKPIWHPAAYHCLDVAAALEALLITRPHWLTALAELAGLDSAEVRRRLLLVAALHDLGKFADNFQTKADDPALHFDHQRKLSRDGHGSVGLALWRKARLTPALDDWMQAATSHHGAPVEPCQNLAEALTPQTRQDAQDFAQAILDLFGDQFGPPAPPQPGRNPSRGRDRWLVAGLVILADWIGSNREWFPFTAPHHSLAEYWQMTRHNAASALQQARLAEATAADRFDLQTVLGTDFPPTPLQDWTQQQTPQGGGHLYIIEDLTGAGKTEAALILAHRLMQAQAAEGIYWALPSMATANGLYRRLETTYQKLFAPSPDQVRPSLVLAHSARDLNTRFQLSIDAPHSPAPNGPEEDVTAEASCAAFIAEDRKKTFLAQVGVGTLDQALLAVLPVRHQSLRLAALARRVLVIDEAHAYDAYMNEGLETLLRFQKTLGGSAIVLSATLTREQRGKLVTAFGGNAQSLTSQDFPLTTHVHGAATEETAQVSQRGTRRDLPFVRLDHPQRAIDALIEQAKAGYCGVYIRNTVSEAMAAYQQLQARWPQTMLFHARFCLGDRLRREEDVLNRFGRDSSQDQRAGWILVATQVVEQSLDLDFDAMATDLCPMDLLIQRAGRLHRHSHRPARPDPVLWVVGGPPAENAAVGWYGDLFPKGQYVYPDVGQLWRTMRVLHDLNGLPQRSRSPRALIEPVFGTGRIDHPAALDRASQEAESIRQAARAIGKLNFLKTGAFERGDSPVWDSDIHTPTRLGEGSIAIRLARWQDGHLTPWAEAAPHPWRLSELSVRAGLFDQPLPPEDSTNDTAAALNQAIAAARRDWPDQAPPILPLIPAADGTWTGRWRSQKGQEIPVRYTPDSGLAWN